MFEPAIRFPSAAERACLRSSSEAIARTVTRTPRASAHPSAGLLAPAGPFPERDGGSEPAGALLPSSREAIGQTETSELPLAAFDRPSCDPREQGGGEGEAARCDRSGNQHAVAGSVAAEPATPSSSGAVGQPIALPGTGPGGSIQAILQKRLQHIAKGFTPESDDARSLKELTTKLRFYADDARAFAFNPRVDCDHAAMRDKLVEVGALSLALIDRLDRDAARKESNHGV